MSANANLMLPWVSSDAANSGEASEFDNLNAFSPDAANISENELERLSVHTWGNYVTSEEAQQLAQVSDTRRIIVINNRTKGISYSALVDVFLAVVIEFIILAGFYLLSHWVFTGQGGGGVGDSQGSSYEATGGIVTSDDSIAPLTADLPAQKTPVTPQLPNHPIWQPAASPTQILNAQNPDNSQQLIIGVKSNQDPWRAPTPQPSIKQTPTVGVNTQSARSSSRNTMPSRDADPDASSFGSPYSFAKNAGPGGLGGDSGPGRGPSDANNPWPTQISTPSPPLLGIYDAVPVSATLQFTVLANGRVDPKSVSVLQSSGHPEVDRAFEDYIKQIVYSPAIIDGQPVAKICELTLSNDVSSN
ncbi:MAG TPA: TonB family protein [Phycisphaerae bacterium]|nr:TonB family protein [Phycisphaerae bacterium]